MTTSQTSVVIPTYQRTAELRQTLQMLAQCVPAPAEILVHVDAGDTETPEMLSAEFAEVIVLQSDERQGPGGGRNKLIAAAKHECIVSLDDDSWPMDREFFQRAADLVENEPQVAVWGCDIHESDGATEKVPAPEASSENSLDIKQASHFVGCGAILRRSAFLQTRGYVPLRQAYGMEEMDMTLQLINAGWEIRAARHLRVFHACDRQQHHSSPGINAAHIRNLALLVFLRYPLRFFPFGMIQVLNRVKFSLRQRRFRGILTGLLTILPACWKYRGDRSRVSVDAVRTFRMLRKQEAENL